MCLLMVTTAPRPGRLRKVTLSTQARATVRLRLRHPGPVTSTRHPVPDKLVTTAYPEPALTPCLTLPRPPAFAPPPAPAAPPASAPSRAPALARQAAGRPCMSTLVQASVAARRRSYTDSSATPRPRKVSPSTCRITGTLSSSHPKAKQNVTSGTGLALTVRCFPACSPEKRLPAHSSRKSKPEHATARPTAPQTG
jgi:hypothetical protein